MPTRDMITLRPFLTVKNGREAVRFYVAAFGAEEIERFELPGDKISSVMQIESAVFYVGDEEPDNGNLSAYWESTNPVRMILQTVRADELFEKAIKSGATVICPMTTESDWRIGKLKDLFGHIWEIGYKL